MASQWAGSAGWGQGSGRGGARRWRVDDPDVAVLGQEQDVGSADDVSRAAVVAEYGARGIDAATVVSAGGTNAPRAYRAHQS